MARHATARRSAEPAPERRSPPRERPVVVHRQRTRRRVRRRMRLGFAVIPMVAILFGGVVFANTVELGLVSTQGQVTRQTIEVQEQIKTLRAEQARRDLIVRNRAPKLGLVRPLTDALNFLDARPLAKP